jgi:SAM-dependent methyltransferase
MRDRRPTAGRSPARPRLGYLPVVSGGEGFQEHDELLSHEAAVELVRKRASAERGSAEPDWVAASAHRERLLPLTLPDPNLGGGLRAFLKRTIARLTRWQLAPLLRQLNNANAEYRERLAAEEARSNELAAGLEELKLASGRVGREDEGLATAAAAGSDGSDDLEAFYEAHQERFRGSRESVRARLEIYLPQVQSVASPGHPVLDLGSGRGEWLALLTEHGIAAYGVDINSSFVAGGSETGLDVRQADAIEHLRSVPDGSLSAVTAFHLVEHLPPAALVDLVGNAVRALRPGGLLILETPNPLNLKVGAASFHIDPTHVRPIHPLFLEFVLENRGFAEVRTAMVNAPSEPPLAVAVSADAGIETLGRMAELLNEAFFVGTDYAVIGRRAGPGEETPAPPDGLSSA